jgi:hypothetical protein
MGLPNGSLLSGFPAVIFYLPVHATCLAHLILNSIIIVISDEYKWWRLLLCSLLLLLFLWRHVFLSIPFSYTPTSLCSSLRERDQVIYSYKRRGEILNWIFAFYVSRHSDQGTGWTADEVGFSFRKGYSTCLFHSLSIHIGGGGPPSAFNLMRSFLRRGLKRPGREANHSPLPNTEVESAELCL